MNKELVKISPTGVLQTLEKCSWIYYCKTLKLPSSGNSGSSRGGIVHLIFEQLSNPRHFNKYAEKLLQTKNFTQFPSIIRLIKKTAAKLNLDLNEKVKPLKHEPLRRTNFDLIYSMILVGLEYDFFNGSKLLGSELQFDFVNEDPEYRIKCIIDRVEEKNGEILIKDFKSSSSLFDEKTIHQNYQALCYLLVIKKKYEKFKKRKLTFSFLRFPDAPHQTVEVSDEVLEGFEQYVAHVQKYIQNFTFKKAISDMAADKGFPGGFAGRVMCGNASFLGELKADGSPKWNCEYKHPRDYYCLYDKENTLLKTSWNNDLVKKNESDYVVKKAYLGCAAFYKSNYSPKFENI